MKSRATAGVVAVAAVLALVLSGCGSDTTTSTLGEYPAYQLGDTWQSEGMKKITAQKTVVIPGPEGLYVLQLNADGLEAQTDIISNATDAIDSQTTISF